MSKILPKSGDFWHLKRNSKKVCKVTQVDLDDDGYESLGYVHIEAPWLTRRHSGRSLDVFLKQYKKLKDQKARGE